MRLNKEEIEIHLLFNFAINFLVISLNYYFSVVNLVIIFYY